VSEGFASYYQNVLLARRGVYSEQDAWNRFHRAFVRAARVADPPPLNELHRRDFREVRMLLYWSGAALALKADVALRSAGGADSLDTVLGRLAACCLPSRRVWRADELFARLDQAAGRDVFMPLFEAQMREPGMPDLAALYADLGIEPLSDSHVRLSRSGRLTSVREAIMAPRD
jgi:predicted metalloprotease with PDZ domain